MTENRSAVRLGRVLRASTVKLCVGCRTMETDLPRFGSLVRVNCNGGAIYGLIYNVEIDDDLFVRQLIAAGDLREEYVEDQRQRRQVPVEVNILVVGERAGDAIYYRLPPQPPPTLSWAEVCPTDEVRAFGQRLGFVRIVLNAVEAPTDELLAAALRQIAATQGDAEQAQRYLVEAGRELARLLGRDPLRLDGILNQMR
jgi:hypothetical protein